MESRFITLLTPFLKFAGDREITEDSDLREWGLDSMQAIELLFAIEDCYGIALPDDELNDDTFATAGSLWRVVAAQVQEAAA
ncbi:phosphopantetheine-binding protein [Saccharopolyspora tripterygii]